MSDYDDFTIEAYCVRCKEKVEIESPQAVWTRKGLPATRGECPQCGCTVYRMGRVELHAGIEPFEADEIPSGPIKLDLSAKEIALIYVEADTDLGLEIEADLNTYGFEIKTLSFEQIQDRQMNDKGRYLILCSAHSAAAIEQEEAFLSDVIKSKAPLMILELGPALTIPAPLRRAPRYAMYQDYKAALRQLVDRLG